MTDFHGDQSNPRKKSKIPPYFDFVIAERPIYIPNSGPPSQPISIMPPHDKDMLIDAEIQLGSNGLWVYQVYNPSKPGLRVSVKPQNILDWVSRRTLEKWELEGPDRRRREQEEFLREQEAEQRAKKLKAPKSRATANGTPKTVQRKQKSAEIKNHSKRRVSSNATVPATLAGPARKRKSVVEDEPVFTSPTTTHKRPKGRSLTTPVKKLEPETDTADEADLDEDDEDEAIARQLQLTTGLRTYGPFTAPIYRPGSSIATTPKRAGSMPKPASSTPKRAPSTPASASRNQPAKSPLFSPRYNVATTSSLDFRKGYEKLEREKEKVAPRPSVKQSIREKYSNFVHPSLFKAPSPSKFPPPSPSMFIKASPNKNTALKHIRSPFTKKAAEEEEDQGEALSSDEPVVEKTLRSKKSAVPEKQPRPKKPEVAEKLLRPKKAVVEEQDSELSGTEWEIEEILDEQEDRLDDAGIPCHQYLIKWVAAPGIEWDDSWEPAENVDEDAIKEFRLKQKKKERERAKSSTQQPMPKPNKKNPAPTLPTTKLGLVPQEVIRNLHPAHQDRATENQRLL